MENEEQEVIVLKRKPSLGNDNYLLKTRKRIRDEFSSWYDRHVEHDKITTIYAVAKKIGSPVYLVEQWAYLLVVPGNKSTGKLKKFLAEVYQYPVAEIFLHQEHPELREAINTRRKLAELLDAQDDSGSANEMLTRLVRQYPDSLGTFAIPRILGWWEGKTIPSDNYVPILKNFFSNDLRSPKGNGMKKDISMNESAPVGAMNGSTPTGAVNESAPVGAPDTIVLPVSTSFERLSVTYDGTYLMGEYRKYIDKRKDAECGGSRKAVYEKIDRYSKGKYTYWTLWSWYTKKAEDSRRTQELLGRVVELMRDYPVGQVSEECKSVQEVEKVDYPIRLAAYHAFRDYVRAQATRYGVEPIKVLESIADGNSSLSKDAFAPRLQILEYMKNWVLKDMVPTSKYVGVVNEFLKNPDLNFNTLNVPSFAKEVQESKKVSMSSKKSCLDESDDGPVDIFSILKRPEERVVNCHRCENEVPLSSTFEVMYDEAYDFIGSDGSIVTSVKIQRFTTKICEECARNFLDSR